MVRIKLLFLLIVTLPGIFSCREKFDPPEVVSPDPLLIVEGMLVAGPATTTIRLSRSAKLDGSNSVEPELAASVAVETKDNTVAALVSAGNGFYSGRNLALQVGTEYRIRITTSNGKIYQSALVTMKQTPPIDSIGFRQVEEGVRLYLNTTDPTGKARYYKWEYDETWEINSFFYARVAYRANNRVTARRIPQEEVFRCWKFAGTTGLLLGSTEQLANDVVFEAPLAFYPNGSERFSVRYSINVKQYALDQQAYEFFELMKKNTENLGTVFDPQPNEISGNVTCLTDPGEVVIGYVAAATESVKRVFISKTQLTNNRFQENCEIRIIKNDADSIRDAFSGGGMMPYDAVVGHDTTHFLASTPVCVDCTKRGGSLVRPAYW